MLQDSIQDDSTKPVYSGVTSVHLTMTTPFKKRVIHRKISLASPQLVTKPITAWWKRSAGRPALPSL